MQDDDLTENRSQPKVPRRTLIKAAAWSVPVVATTLSVPAAATSNPSQTCRRSVVRNLQASNANSWRLDTGGTLQQESLTIPGAPYPGMYLKFTVIGGSGGGAIDPTYGRGAILTGYLLATAAEGKNVRMIAGGAGGAWGNSSGAGNSYGGRGYGDGGISSGPYAGGGGAGSALFIGGELAVVAGGGGGYVPYSVTAGFGKRRVRYEVPLSVPGGASYRGSTGDAGPIGSTAEEGNAFLMWDEFDPTGPAVKGSGTDRGWLEGGWGATQGGPGGVARGHRIGNGSFVQGTPGNAFTAASGGAGGNGSVFQPTNVIDPNVGGAGGGGGYNGGGGGGAIQYWRGAINVDSYHASGGTGGGGSSYVAPNPTVPILAINSGLSENRVVDRAVLDTRTHGTQGSVRLEWVCALGD